MSHCTKVQSGTPNAVKDCTYIFGGGLPTEKVTNGKGLPTEKVYQPLHFYIKMNKKCKYNFYKHIWMLKEE